MTDYELWYALLDNGTLTLGFARFCLLLTITHLLLKFKLQNKVLQLVLRLSTFAAAIIIAATLLPADSSRVYTTLARKLSDRPFASDEQLTRAVQYFSKAVDTGYWNNNLLRDYSGALVRTGRSDEAVQLLASGPWNAAATPELQVPYSRALLAAGKTAEALQIASAALTLPDEFERFWAIRTIAEAFIANRQHEEAARFLETCLPGLADSATRQLLSVKINQIRQGKTWIETH